MINKKALSIFLLLTFGITIFLICIAKLNGFTLVGAPVMMSQLVILVAMFVPGLVAILVQKLVVKKSLKELGFKWGPWSMYLKTYALVVLMFAINYAIVWALILRPDFTLNSFLHQYNITSALPLPAPLMIGLFAIMTFFISPIFNMIPSLGEEIGWRGFLLPNLEPLGKVKAVILSGMIWALWHTPMILILGFLYGAQMWPGIILHFIMVTGIGIWMGYIWFKTRSTVLSAFIHSVFNANAYGVWVMIFVSSNALVVGAAGLVGVLLCLILGIVTLFILNGDIKKGIIK